MAQAAVVGGNRVGLLGALGAGLVLLAGLALAALNRGAVAGFVLVHAVHAAIYVGCVAWILSRRRRLVDTPAGDGHSSRLLLVIIGVAVLMRLVALAAPPVLTTDAYRYVWDGRVQASGINPYRYVPAAPELAHLRDTAIFPNINRADTHPTIYPPVAELLFLAGTRLIDGIRGLQILMLLCEFVTLWALVRWLAACGPPRERVLIYAWHPLPLWEFAGMAHIDGAGLMFVCLALLAGQTRRQSLAGATFAAAGLVKYHLVLLVPAVWRRWGWKMPAAMLGAALFCYLPYLSAGSKLLGSLFVHLDEEVYRDGYGFFLVGFPKHFGLPHVPSLVFAGLAALVLIALGAFVALRPQSGRIEPQHMIWLATAFLVLISPHYPWYYTLAVPLLCARMSWPLVWITLLVSGVYLEGAAGWLEPFTRLKVFTAMFGGALVLAIGQWWWRRDGFMRAGAFAAYVAAVKKGGA